MSAPSARANPYQTPTSALRALERALEPRRIVKLYFAMLATLLLTQMAVSLAVAPPLRLLGVAMLASALPALFGYAYRRRIGRAWLWQLWFPASVVGAVIAPVDLLLRLTPPLLALRYPLAAQLYAHLFALPLVGALYLYAFRSPEIWRRS